MIEVREIEDKNFWEDFLVNCNEKTFLNSWNWGEFNKKMGNKIWRFGIYSNGELFSVALVIKILAKRGTFLFLPHGPNIKEGIEDEKKKILERLLEKLKELAKKEGAFFIRIAPIFEKNKENIKIFKELGFRDAPIHIHPELTWQLNIERPEKEILMGMRKTTRYLIRQALKNKEIEILKSKNIEDLKIFNDLYQETVERHHFVPFSFDYLKNEFLAFLPDDQILIFLGKYKGEIVSGAIILFWQKIAFYHHGASSLKYPKIPVSYLLQWESIKEAKNRGCKIYNFWGIAPTDDPRHPWAGLSLFKKGFGGEKKEYVKTQDFALSKKYYFTFLIEKIRSKKRGF